MALIFIGMAAEPSPAGGVRPAVWAGRFYPADPAGLEVRIAELVQRAAASTALEMPAGRLKAVVMPHAGYAYSGPTAAHGARAMAGRRYGKVILVGPDHRVGLRNAAVSDADAWQTPLGAVPLHEDARRLCRSSLFSTVEAADRQEHSLEVVLPFLQYALADFRLVPIVMGPAEVGAIAGVLDTILDDDTLLVVSSDLSHYLPDSEARVHDRITLDLLMDLDAKALIQRENGACGKWPLAVLATIARQRNWHPVLLNYATSGNTTGDLDRVVGYAAVAFYGDNDMKDRDGSTPSPAVLTEDQGRLLLQLARQTIARRLDQPADGGDAASRAAADPALRRPSGTFVTLKIDGQLRGCIGSLEPREALFESVRNNAINATFHDWRINPLSNEGLARVHIEVSILTPPAPLAYRGAGDLKSALRPGIDGLIIRKGSHSATFLPQVWEQLPRVEDFLSHLCLKAGLEGDAWRRGDLSVETYRVHAFEEP